MYKSSSLTFFYKYLFTPIWGGVFLSVIIISWTQEDQFTQSWSRSAALMVSWGLLWLTILMMRLRNVEATLDYLIVKKLKGREIIDYRDVEYVSQIALVNPLLISIKYRNAKTGESHRILIMPGTSSLMFNFSVLKDHDMTRFIREQIVSVNPNYNTESEPSRWLTFGLIILTGLPVILYQVIFLRDL